MRNLKTLTIFKKLVRRLKIRTWVALTIITILLPIAVISLFVAMSVIGAPPVSSATWHMDEANGTTLNDATNNSNSGTITNAAWRAKDFCLSENCLFFDGTDDRVSRADDADFDFAAAESFTFSVWFRHAPKTSGTDVILAKLEAVGTDGGYRMQMESDGDITCEIEDADADTTIDDSITSTAATYDDTNWHHIACVKNGTTSLTLYIDGVSVATDTSLDGSGTLANDETFYLGSDDGGSTNEYTGLMDEFRLYRQALTAAEVLVEYNQDSALQFSPQDANFLTDGLIGYWRLDETSGDAADSSGSGSTLTNVSTTPYTGAVYGNGAELDGSTDYLYAADSSILSITGNVTLSAWIEPDDVSGSEDIIGKWDGSNESYLLAKEGANIRMYIDSASNYRATTGSPLSANTKTHVAGVYDALTASVKLYVNGVEVASATTGTIPSSIGDDAGRLQVGAEDSTTTAANFFDGHIDEARLYSRALGGPDIKSLYAWGPAPVGHWKFDENTGTSTSVDSSGNGNSLTLNNQVATNWTQGKMGSALNFTSTSSQYGTVSDTSSLSITGSFSMAAWIKPASNTASTTYPIAGKDDGTTRSYQLIQFGDELRLYVGSSSNYVTTDATNLSTGTWYHVEVIYNATSSTASIYVNGQVQAATTTGTLPSSISDATNAFNVSQLLTSSSATVNLQVGASAGDAEMQSINNDVGRNVTQDNVVSITSGLMQAGSHGANNEYTVGARFTSVTVPNAATITSATYTMTPHTTYSAGGSVVKYHVSGQAADDPGVFTTVSGNLNTTARPRTTADCGPWTQTSVTADVDQSISVTSCIQELVNRAGWASGNAMVIIVDTHADTTQGEWQDYCSWDNVTAPCNADHTNAPKLDITYSSTTSSYYDGVIDDLKVYNYIRSSSQIIEDMNGGHPSGGSPIGSQSIYWKLDEGYGTTAFNTVDANTDGTLTSMASPATSTSGWTNSGKINRALVFDGSDDKVTIATASDSFVDFNGSEKFTLSAWIYPTTAPGATDEDIIIGKWDETNTAEVRAYRLYLTDADTDSALNLVGELYDESANQTLSAATTNEQIALNTWTYVTLTHNGGVAGAAGDLEIYINAKSAATNSANASFLGVDDVSSDFTVGDYDATDGFSGNTAFTGRIDEVQVYADELSSDQVKILMNVGSAANFGAGTNEYAQVAGSSTSVAFDFWNFDEGTGQTVNDTGSNNIADCTVGKTSSGASDDPSWLIGKVGNALSFDGSSDVVDCDDNSTLDFADGTSFTLTAWIYRTSVANDANIISKKTSSASNTAGFSLYQWSSGNGGNTCLYVSDGTDQLERCTNDNATTTTGAWVHVAAVFDDASSANTTLYLNGLDARHTAYDAGTIGNVGSLSSTANFHIGAQPQGVDGTPINFFAGRIDQVKVFTYALSPAQINYEMSREKPMGYWKFDDCTGTTINDSSFNAAGTGSNAETGTITIGASGSNDAAGTCAAVDTTTAWYNGRNGKFGSSLDFDGTDDYVDIGDSSIMDFGTSRGGSAGTETTQDFSYSFWINRRSFTTEDTVIANANGQAASNTGYIVWIDDSTDDVNFALQDGTDQFSINGTTAITATGWHHVVVVFDEDSATNSTIYVDGKADKESVTGTITNVGLMDGPSLQIGTESDEANWFDGQIDDVQFFPYAVSANQALRLYNENAGQRFGPSTGSP